MHWLARLHCQIMGHKPMTSYTWVRTPYKPQWRYTHTFCARCNEILEGTVVTYYG